VFTLLFFSSKCRLFHNSSVFGSCIIHILYTGCAKIKKNNSGAKRLIQHTHLSSVPMYFSHEKLHNIHCTESGRHPGSDIQKIHTIFSSMETVKAAALARKVRRGSTCCTECGHQLPQYNDIYRNTHSCDVRLLAMGVYSDVTTIE